MDIVIGADHGGFQLKEAIKKHLKGKKVIDLGTDSAESVDYPDFAKKVAEKVAKGGSLGILLCGTGIGVSITANKVIGIRAALCHSAYTAKMARSHNNANILCMGGRTTDEKTALEMVDIFLKEAFSPEQRHHRRVDKMNAMDAC